jgi:hypothetical protein
MPEHGDLPYDMDGNVLQLDCCDGNLLPRVQSCVAVSRSSPRLGGSEGGAQGLEVFQEEEMRN